MKTFEINEDLENKLQHISNDLKLDSITELLTLGLHMVSLINRVEKEGGSLFIENSKGFKMPLHLTAQKKDAVESNILKQLNKPKKSKKSTKKKSSKSK